MLSILVAGCVIPPSLSVENQDAGVNSPPAITAVRSEGEELTEADTTKAALFVPGQGTVNVALLDTDIFDTLYVRVFVNYTAETPEPARSQCTSSPNDSTRRTVTCDVSGVCFPADLNKTLNMKVMVFDREVLESGEPLHQAVAEGGLSTSKFFFITCGDP